MARMFNASCAKINGKLTDITVFEVEDVTDEQVYHNRDK